MATPTTELMIPLRLSESARAKLAERAAQNGQDVAAYASGLVEQAVTQPTIDEILAPYRKQVAESSMSDEKLDDFHRELLTKARN
jgi:hypothetical protein